MREKSISDEKKRLWKFKMRDYVLMALFRNKVSLDEAIDILGIDVSMIEEVI